MSAVQHSGRVNDLRAFPGGIRAVSGGGKQVCAWERAGGALLWMVDADAYEVSFVLPHSSGCVISSGSHGTISVLEGDTGARRCSFELEQPGGRLFELPDGRVVVGLEELEDLHILDPLTGVHEQLAAQGEQNPALEIHVEGTRLQSIGPSAGVCTWDLASRAFQARVMPPEGETYGFLGTDRAITCDGSHIAIWRTSDGHVLHRVNGLEEVHGALASPGGQHVAARIERGVALIDADSGKLERTLDCGPFPRHTRFSRDGEVLAVVMNTQARALLQLFETASGKDLGKWEGDSVSALSLAMEQIGAGGWLLLGMQNGRVQSVAL